MFCLPFNASLWQAVAALACSRLNLQRVACSYAYSELPVIGMLTVWCLQLPCLQHVGIDQRRQT